MLRPGLLLAVGLGSAIGALLRYGCSWWVATPIDTLPLATLLVNVIGSFWIGCYASLTGPGGRWQVSDWQKQFMLSGVCAGFTTFSIFSLEVMQLVQAEKQLLAAGYMVLSLLLWLMACGAGLWLGTAHK
jgi:CrcB protein